MNFIHQALWNSLCWQSLWFIYNRDYRHCHISTCPDDDIPQYLQTSKTCLSEAAFSVSKH